MQLRTRVKICGITRCEDAQAAVSAGADALGFVFYPPSPRNIDISTAQTIIAQLPPFINSVALFVDPQPNLVQAVLEQTQIDTIQFHGQELDAFCAQFNKPFFKAISMRSDLDFDALRSCYPSAQGLLFDAYHPHKPGGSGETFEWQRLKQFSQPCSAITTDTLLAKEPPIILAGGLDVDNIEQALNQVQPYAVDVSSGVETAPGIKSATKIQQFIQRVQSSDRAFV